VVDQLSRFNIPFVLIETHEGLYRELLKEGMLVIHGDAKRHDILQTAGIARARGAFASSLITTPIILTSPSPPNP